MKKKAIDFYLHPFLIAVFPVISLYAYNTAYVPVEETFIPFIIVLLFCVASFALFKLLLKHFEKASLATSAFLFFFFSYGTFYYYFNLTSVDLLKKHSFLLLLEGVLFLAFIWVLAQKNKRFFKLNQVANVFAFCLIALPITQLIFAFFQGNLTADADTLTVHGRQWKANIKPEERPDIVYVVLDGYGRHDILKKYYGLDNTEFIRNLEKEGFQVAKNSTSNYVRTVVSVASLLNLNYIQDINPELKGFCFADLEELIEEAGLIKFLLKHGYYLYSFASGYGHTELSRHMNLIQPYNIMPPFYYMLLNKTPYIIIEENPFLHHIFDNLRTLFIKDPEPYFLYRDKHRDMILYSLNHLQDFVGKPQPSFVFADVFVGHPPFIFDRHGNYIPSADPNPMADGDKFSEDKSIRRKKYIEACREQTLYLNKKIIYAVQQIKKKIKRPTIIVLQGDHGPGAHFSHKSLEKSNIEERFSNISAVYFSEGKPLLPDNLSPVNTFRYILNNHFKTSFPILPNRQFYSTEDTPCTFIEVTDTLSEIYRKNKLEINSTHAGSPGKNLEN